MIFPDIFPSHKTPSVVPGGGRFVLWAAVSLQTAGNRGKNLRFPGFFVRPVLFERLCCDILYKNVSTIEPRRPVQSRIPFHSSGGMSMKYVFLAVFFFSTAIHLYASLRTFSFSFTLLKICFRWALSYLLLKKKHFRMSEPSIPYGNCKFVLRRKSRSGKTKEDAVRCQKFRLFPEGILSYNQIVMHESVMVSARTNKVT